VIGSVAWMW